MKAISRDLVKLGMGVVVMFSNGLAATHAATRWWLNSAHSEHTGRLYVDYSYYVPSSRVQSQVLDAQYWSWPTAIYVQGRLMYGGQEAFSHLLMHRLNRLHEPASLCMSRCVAVALFPIHQAPRSREKEQPLALLASSSAVHMIEVPDGIKSKQQPTSCGRRAELSTSSCALLPLPLPDSIIILMPNLDE